MEIFRIIGIGLIAVIISIIIKQYRPEFAIYISLVAGILILLLSFETIKQIIAIVDEYSKRISSCNKFVFILLKITGLSILSEFAISICKDSRRDCNCFKD